ncbi:MAG: DUF2461 domain-containing protein [Oscillospiraceae bacterium]|jgi:Uncharacterized conserved protein|nr:DUF2461 domain-containing protein [Oscillospiraceae bacterium]
MFEGFTKETGEFLWELRFNNERPWFLAHKEQYERCLNRPFRALAQESWRLLSERYPERDFRVHVSRIYRDARRLFGRGPYKDHLWFSLYTSDKNEGPSFWFEIGAAGYTYGLGFWSMRPALMERFRRAVDANPARFERLARQAEALPGLRLLGEEYRRPKGDRGELLNRWYNRKYLTMEFSGDFGGDLFSPALAQILCGAYGSLMPMHDFLAEVWEAAREEERE